MADLDVEARRQGPLGSGPIQKALEDGGGMVVGHGEDDGEDFPSSPGNGEPERPQLGIGQGGRHRRPAEEGEAAQPGGHRRDEMIEVGGHRPPLVITVRAGDGGRNAVGRDRGEGSGRRGGAEHDRRLIGT
jgi:hypothetical protein